MVRRRTQLIMGHWHRWIHWHLGLITILYWPVRHHLVGRRRVHWRHLRHRAFIMHVRVLHLVMWMHHCRRRHVSRWRH